MHLVTQARRPLSEDIATRQRRYLIMMMFRAGCFGLTVLLFFYGFRWWAAIPAAFAIFVPYVAVIYANGGREPDNSRGFREYRVDLPERHNLPRVGGPNNGRGSSGHSSGEHGANGHTGNVGIARTGESGEKMTGHGQVRPSASDRPVPGSGGPDDSGTGPGG